MAFFRVFALGCVISFSCCAFRVPFWSLVQGAVLLFFSVGLFGVFLFVFSLLFGLFVSLFGLGCWAPCCSSFGRTFWTCFCLCFLFFLSFFRSLFGPWVLGVVLLFFRSGFLGVFWCFSLFLRNRFFHFLISWPFFVVFFFLFIFALTFHKCQMAKKAFVSFLFFAFFLTCFFFPFIFALTFHKCQFVKKAFLHF